MCLLFRQGKRLLDHTGKHLANFDRTHMKYQQMTVGPHFVKKYILRRKGLKEPQLYHFDDDEEPRNVEGLADKPGVTTV
jgi:hypothetical protein